MEATRTPRRPCGCKDVAGIARATAERTDEDFARELLARGYGAPVRVDAEYLRVLRAARKPGT